MNDDELAIRRAVDALADTLHATIELCATLDPRAWQQPTACPGWTVHDQVAHLAGIEAKLLGRPRATLELPPLAHVVNDVDREVELDVHARRTMSDADLLAELREVVEARVAALHAAPPAPTDRLPFLGGTTRPALVALTLRVLDAWTHGEDIRRAVGAPPDVDAPAAELTAEQFLRGFAAVVERAGAPDGAVVRLDITGDRPRTEVVAVAAEPTAPPTVTLVMDLATYTARSAGRITTAEADVTIQGDRALGTAVLEAMVLTP